MKNNIDVFMWFKDTNGQKVSIKVNDIISIEEVERGTLIYSKEENNKSRCHKTNVSFDNIYSMISLEKTRIT